MIVNIDDIMVTGLTDEEHLASLEEVLDRIESAGLRLKRRKCSFMAKSVVFLGYQMHEAYTQWQRRFKLYKRHKIREMCRS